MKRIHLVAQIYRPKSGEHLKRMVDCVEHNANLAFVERITLLDEGANILWRNKKIRTVSALKRGTFGDLLNELYQSGDLASTHFGLLNTDIFLTEDIERVMGRITRPTSVAAVTRRELGGELRPEPQCSQDAWIFLRHLPLPRLAEACQFRLGIAGCENLFAMALYSHGYEIWNPCEDCVITHNDPDPRMNFPEWVFGAYLWLPPCRVEDIQNKPPVYKLKVHRGHFSG